MPEHRQVITFDHVRRFVETHCFTPSPAGRVGAEVEWIPFPPGGSYVDFARLRESCARAERSGGSALTFEPGAQLELSSPACDDVASCIDAIAKDKAAIENELAADGITLAGIGLDPIRPERRVLHRPRYDAMEAFFALDSPSGRTMMCSTASIQVNLDAGATREEIAWRWRLAHRIGPVLAAAFADSPFWCTAPSAWRSARAATWFGIDNTRTAACPDGDPVETWTRYLLDARVMMIRTTDDAFTPIVRPFTFGQWVADGHELGWPTEDDLTYHLSTLFPPVRARGWLELRMIDALPEPYWRVPIALCARLLYDRDAGERAFAASEPVAGMWRAAARDALDNPLLAAAATEVFAAAADDDDVAAYVDRFVSRARTPADDRLDAWTTTGSPLDPSPLREAVWT
jgi:glutamate--cysteine ligase